MTQFFDSHAGYPLDNRFRKPVEWYSTLTCLAAMAVVGHYYRQVGISRWSFFGIECALLALAVLRAWQGWKIYKFHINLRWLPTYELTSEAIPYSPTELFLGMGFWWSQPHSQRLYQARLPENKHLRARNESYMWARAFSREHPGHWASRWMDKPSRLNPVAPLPPVGGDPAIHGIEPDERAIWTARSERVAHTVVLGTTRVGKTRLAELLVTQDIRRGNVVIVFDPKGDAQLLMRMYAECSRCGRAKDFWFFHLGFPEISDRYSPISSIGRITEVATRIANPIPGEGNSAAFKQFVWLYVNIIARAASALGMSPTYKLIYQYAADLDGLAEQYLVHWLDREHPGWADSFDSNADNMNDKMRQARIQQTGRTLRIIELMDFLGKTDWHDPIADGLLSVLANNKSKYQALINSLFPLLEKLTTGKVSELLSPDWDNMDDARRIFDWDKIMDTGGVVYVGLDSLSDPEVAAAVGNAMFADLTSTAGRRYKYGTAYGQRQSFDVKNSRGVSIHADEFNELIGDEFVPMLNKAGGAGYEVTVYTQTWSDVEAKIGNRAKAAQIGGNLNTLIMLRVKNVETAELLTDQLPKVEIQTSTLTSGANDVQNPDDFADFSSSAQDRITAREVPMLSPADLVQLPKGQAFALLEGGQLVKVRLPLATSTDDDPHWPRHLTAVTRYMRQQYARYVEQVEGEAAIPGDFEGGAHGEVTVEGKGHGF